MKRTPEEQKEYDRIKAAEYRSNRTPEQHEADKQKARDWFHRNKNNPRFRNRKNLQRQEHYARNRESILAQERNATALLRLEVIQKLGGECSSCGLGDHRALEIDHINGDGYLERSSTVHSCSRYRQMLRQENLQQRYQILCGSCHNIKTYENDEHRRREARPQPLGNVSAIQSIPKEI